ncbi:MAG: PKD domain-containing protein, partial [Thermoplasmata archaeon]|nr:PKD domain-containing protein [Thermoplasmata archaeon]
MPIRISKIKSHKTNPKKANKTSGRTWKAIAIALYITFILLSTIAFVADRSIEPNMKDSYEHHLTYPRDGRQSHYYVERVNTSKIGKIDLVYTTASNSLDVDCYNIKILYIYCRSLYKDECRDVFGIDPNDNSNYYKWYFVEKNHFNVNIDTDYEIEKLSFMDTPLAYKVVVNGEIWTEGEDYFYEGDYGIALSHVPEGHTNVDLYFKPEAGTPPIAMLNVSRTLTPVNQTVTFDASGSLDPDGRITEYIFDFGNGVFKGGNKHDYYYSKPGTYGVILTVRDNDYLVDRAYANITVVTFDIPGILGHVPNQIKPEDEPPWALNLSMYEPPDSTIPGELIWYITGEDNSLYTVSGENSTNDQLIFTPVPDAYGNDLVTLWMHSPGNISMSQSLWVNLTPVNDAPTLASIPDLI